MMDKLQVDIICIMIGSFLVGWGIVDMIRRRM